LRSFEECGCGGKQSKELDYESKKWIISGKIKSPKRQIAFAAETAQWMTAWWKYRKTKLEIIHKA
jgi:hypothetical protein